MNKIITIVGVFLIISAILFSALSFMPPELGFEITKFIFWMKGENTEHMYLKVVPSTNKFDYILPVLVFLMGTLFIYFGALIKKKKRNV